MDAVIFEALAATSCGLIAIALCVEAATGYPKALFRAIGHPVSWVGALIRELDKALNLTRWSSAKRRMAGVATALLVLAVSLAAAISIVLLSPDGWLGIAIQSLIASTLLASRSLHQHVAAVAASLKAGRLDDARAAVAMIVGRDVTRLDEPGVARAAIESLAENMSDGVVAPVFWGALLGLPGLVAYKAINTTDSMIGHRTPRHEAFGWAAARLDDLANLIPARLTALILAIASGAGAARAVTTAIRDAARHRSPNAGWPEAAMAGALGIRLSGPRIYADRISDEPWLNAEGRDPVSADLRRALSIYRIGCALLLVLLVAGSFAQSS